MLLAVAHSPPRSRAAAEELETELLQAIDLPGVEDFTDALAQYEPREMPGDFLIGFDGLRRAALETLHDLGRHDLCAHPGPVDGEDTPV